MGRGSGGSRPAARSSTSTPRPPTAPPSRLASGQGSAIAVSARTLWKRLAAAGLLAMRDADQNTVKAQIGSERKRVIAVTLVSIPPQSGQSGRAGQEAPEAAETADACPENPPCFPADPELSGREIRAETRGNGGVQGASPCSPCSPCFSEDTEPSLSTAAPNGRRPGSGTTSREPPARQAGQSEAERNDTIAERVARARLGQGRHDDRDGSRARGRVHPGRRRPAPARARAPGPGGPGAARRQPASSCVPV